MKYPTRQVYLKDPEARRIIEAMPARVVSEMICAAIVAQYSEDAKLQAIAKLKLAIAAIEQQ